MVKYLLYRRSSSDGTVYYKCDFEDNMGKRYHSSLESKAIRYEAQEAVDMATDREWFIQGVNDEG